MKNRVKNMLSVFALIVLFSLFQGYVVSNNWELFGYVFELFITTALVFIGQYFTDKFDSPYRIIELGLEFLMVTVVVLACGHYFGWYRFPNVGSVIWIIVVVYVISYFLDIAKTKKEAEEVNQMIKIRKMQRAKGK